MQFEGVLDATIFEQLGVFNYAVVWVYGYYQGV
jgi:hypothetical protein